MRVLQGLVGAHGGIKEGVEGAALGSIDARINPDYGVFSPVGGEYVDLVAKTPLPEALESNPWAFDIGTGTGVLSAVLVRRGIERVVATDMSDRAVSCAQDNLQALVPTGQGEPLKTAVISPGHTAMVGRNPRLSPSPHTAVSEP